MKLGIVDMGTNSIHMILVDVAKDMSIKILDRDKEFTRLGDQTFVTQKLSPETINRAISTLKRFKRLAQLRGVSKMKIVATSAVREAQNGGELVEKIYRQVGYRVRVITGEEEARLIYQAVRNTIPLDTKPQLIVDIGGGSVEMVLANKSGIIDCASLKLGTIRLKDQFLNRSPTAKQIRKMEDYIGDELKKFLLKIKKHQVKSLIVTSGTLLNMVTMTHALGSDKPLNQLHHHQVPVTRFNMTVAQIIASDSRSRAKMKGLDPARVDLILPGAYVIRAILSAVPVEKVIACDAAIREGMMYDYILGHKNFLEVEGQVPDIRQRNVLQLARKCHYDKLHSEKVASLAVRLFDQTKKWHQLGRQERDLLEYSALLHDIGYHIHFKKHHQHSYYLIKNGEMSGFDASQIEMMANMARYHSKNMPKKGHEAYGRLTKLERRVVEVGSALLRIADALDRSHFQLVKNISLRSRGNQVVAYLDVKSKCELEIWSALHRKDLFERVFGREISFKYKGRLSH